jgi:hypothetical protein
MTRALILIGSLLLFVPASAAAKPPARCSGSLVWRGSGAYALTLRCQHTVKQVSINPNAPLTLSAMQAHGCTKRRRGKFTCANARRLSARVTTPQDQACTLRLALSGAGMRPLALLAVGCPVRLHFRVDYTGQARGIESADVFSTWTSNIDWAVHFGDLALSLPAPSTAQSASRTVSGTWQFNTAGCVGSIAELDTSPAKIYAVADQATGSYLLLAEAALHLGTGAVTAAGTSPFPCRQWDGGAVNPRGTTTYPPGGRVSYTASLQTVTSVPYAALARVEIGHNFVAPLQGPNPALKPTSFTGPLVSWTGQIVLTRTG